MLFVSIGNPDLLPCVPKQADGIELRLDLFPAFNLELVKKLVSTSMHPLLFTLRKNTQGGMFRGSESEREALIEQLLTLEPAFFDLEYDMRPEFIKRICQKYHRTQFLISYHNFQETPGNLEAIYNSLSKYPAHGYKIAAHAQSTNDALRMLLLSKKHPRLSAICIGDKGEFARILGPVCGNLTNYSSLSLAEKIAPGQLPIADLIDIYNYPKLNPQTNLYGLIGDPVNKSQGHLYHNAFLKKNQINRVYVKMVVKPEELSTFFPLALEIGFRGLSVTMPLKEKILPFLNSIHPMSERIGAINTLLLKKGQITGLNTDGRGALDAIEKRKSVYKKKMVLVGAGGTSRAIAFEAKKRGADIFIVNRTLQKAMHLANEIGCECGSLSDIPLEYDILVNCSSESIPIDQIKVLPSAIIMDVVYVPRETPLLQKARNLGCQVIYGEEMFFNQAALQIEEWMKP